MDPDLPPLGMGLDDQRPQLLRFPELEPGEFSLFAVRFGEHGGAANHGTVHVELHGPDPQLVVTKWAGQSDGGVVLQLMR